jgi:hypothetical protein
MAINNSILTPLFKKFDNGASLKDRILSFGRVRKGDDTIDRSEALKADGGIDALKDAIEKLPEGYQRFVAKHLRGISMEEVGLRPYHRTEE